MSESQPEATPAKVKVLSRTNVLLFAGGALLGAVLVVGISTLLLSQAPAQSASASQKNVADADGVMAACREFIVEFGKSIYDPGSVDPSYVSASKLTTNVTLKQALVDFGANNP